MKKIWKGFVFGLLLMAGMVVFLPAQAQAAKPTLAKKSVEINVGQKVRVKVKNAGNKTVKWTSADPGVAKILSSGKIKGKSAGSTTVTAKVGKYKLKCKVTVKNVLKVYKDKVTVKKGTPKKVRCDLLVDNSTIGATTSDKKIATVSFDKFNGAKTYLNITPVANGTTTIIVNNSYNNEQYEIQVTVTGF